ncbi:unnamed protein product [Lymnaea stagnalis]|uniref:Fibronectin type-III domain-containing protein n=1 Tax=Lymnaea stagnalis TaxID=6523 RepID=A0AAV2HDN6_LYMST
MTSVQMTTLFLLLALSPVTGFSLRSLLEEVKGKIIGREFVYVGDELQLTCVLDSNEFTARNITFTVYYPFEIYDTRKCINQEHVHVINDSTAVLSVPNISRAGRVEYSCSVGSECINNIPSSDEWVDSLDISIQYRPQNITNFTCVVFDFDENMNCTWQHPVPYNVNLNNTYVSLVYTTDAQHFNHCPQLNFNGCFWDRLTGGYKYIMEVNVTVKNTKDTASQIFIVTPSQNAKPAPVTDLFITNTTNKNEFLLSWNQKRYWRLIFQVFHKCPEDADFKMIANNITATNLTYELRPNTMHTFYVQCYPGNEYSGYWSDKTFYSYLTPEQPPSLGPETTNGSYSDLIVSCVDDNDRRKVMVFWKNVKEMARNGVITSYSVQFEGNVLKNVAKDSHSATVEVPCYNKQPVDLEIAAVNSAGESTIPSVVRLAPLSFQVPSKVKESFAIEWNGTNAKAFWNGSDHNMNTSYTVFWCIEDIESPCKGPIDWSHVPESQSYLDIPELPSKATDYHFGLAVRDGENASGIQWTDCWFNPHPSSLPSPKILNIQPDTESAIVVWQKIPCTKKSQLLLTGYRVLWCQQQKCNDSSSIQNVDLAASSSSFKVSRLEANTIYKVTVLSKVHDQLGQELLWKEVTPKSLQSKTPEIVGSIVATGLLISVFVFVIFVRKCLISRKRAKDLRNEETSYVSPRVEDMNLASPDVLIPENPPVPMDQTNNRSIAESPSAVLNTVSDSSFSDSGRGSDSKSRLIKKPKKSQAAKSPKPNKPNSKKYKSVPLRPMSPEPIPTTPEVATVMPEEQETSLQDGSDLFLSSDTDHQGLSELHGTSLASHSTDRSREPMPSYVRMTADSSSRGEENSSNRQALTRLDEGSANVKNRNVTPVVINVLLEEKKANEREASHLESVQEYMTIGEGDSLEDLIHTGPAVVGQNPGLLLSQAETNPPKVLIETGDQTPPNGSSSLPHLDSGTSLHQSMSKSSQVSLQSFPDDLIDGAILPLYSTSEHTIPKRLADDTGDITDWPVLDPTPFDRIPDENTIPKELVLYNSEHLTIQSDINELENNFTADIRHDSRSDNLNTMSELSSTDYISHTDPSALHFLSHPFPPASDYVSHPVPSSKKLSNPVISSNIMSHLVPPSADYVTHPVPPSSDYVTHPVPPSSDYVSHPVPPSSDYVSHPVPPSSDYVSHPVRPSSDNVSHPFPSSLDYVSHPVPPSSDYVSHPVLPSSDYVTHPIPSSSDYVSHSVPSSSDYVSHPVPPSSDNVSHTFPHHQIMCHTQFPHHQIMCHTQFPHHQIMFHTQYPHHQIMCHTQFPHHQIMYYTQFPHHQIM